MDPITLAIVAAVAAGVTVGATEVGKQVVIDAYNGFKGILKTKFGSESQLVKALTDLEANPESKGRQITMEEEVKAAKADEDQEILKSAQDLLDKIKAEPDGAQTIQHIQKVYGDYSAAAGPYGTATVNVTPPHKE